EDGASDSNGFDADEELDGSIEPGTADGMAGNDVDEGTGGVDSARDAGTATADTGSPVDSGKPYLGTMPSGYVADIVVMDWLEFLVGEAGVDGAARTIAYYEAIDWIDGAAAETLQTFLKGFGDGVESDPDPRSSLTVAHHNRSLRFISRIANPDMEMVAFDERAGAGSPGRGSGPEAGRTPRTPDRRGVESDGGHDLAGSRDRVPDDSLEGGRSRSRPPERTSGSDRPNEGFDWGDERTE
ncbi:FlaD/FlaE family flagellar protein, partial [Natronomonas sp.]|uniref:FlaD/FlaE family flagellar protein n=1 Tax=Natronomonas sp. TaxID=2184060 RepID=UPI00398A4AE6